MRSAITLTGSHASAAIRAQSRSRVTPRRRWVIALCQLVAAVALLGSVAVGDAAAAPGDLTQKAGLPGCVSETGSGGECTDGKALDFAISVTVSPDGTSVYATSFSSAAVDVFDRAADGTLTQKAGPAGCISETGSGGACTDGKALGNPTSVTVSPDGTSVYVASQGSDAVAVFDRAADGTLTQKTGPAGCISQTGSGGDCTDGRALDGAQSVTVSPNGKSVYAAAFRSDAVAVFDRAADGTLTQKTGTAGCVSETGSGGDCTDGKALDIVETVIVSPDGTSVYVASGLSDAVAVFDRAADGTLTQKAGTAGCTSDDGSSGVCTDGKALSNAFSVTVSSDGKSVYVASSSSNAVAVFDRAADGTLIQKTGTAGCISDDGSGGDCTDGKALDRPFSVIVSPDGKSVYAATGLSDAVAVFDRAADGTLTQKTGTAGCISETGSGGDCTDGKALDEATSVTVSPDGTSVYAASFASAAVVVFDREVPAPAYADVVLADGPAGYWRFGEPAGLTALDSSGNGNDGTYLGLPQLGVPGALAADPNTAVRMDGVNDTVRVPDANTLDVGNTFTAEGWIKRTATTKVHELMNKSFQLSVMGAANGNQVFLRKPNVSTIARTTGGIGTGAYHHIAVTKNGSGPGSVKFYIDGAPAPSVDVSAAQVIVDNNTLLTFGAAGSTSADYDEFAIYDGVLSAAQIQAHYDAGAPAM
jgi:DNA-binding beta-propeller fold protein YncE